MNNLSHIVLLLFALSLPATGQRDAKSTAIVGGGCDGCELIFAGMPKNLSWETTISGKSEPGAPLEMSGVIYAPDGKTPAANVVLYVYQTDAKGYYSPSENQTAARRHGRLRAWMKTDERGRYRFRTIRPAPYPDARIPAHIHPIIKEPGKNEYYIDEYVFDDDSFVTKAERERHENRGGNGIVTLSKNSDGVWVGRRDITLGLNIPNYPE